jgi:Flp pilus assembly CpaE family ATPase
MASDSPPNVDTIYPEYPDFLDVRNLSIALIGPDESLRRSMATALADCHAGGEVRQFTSYPPTLDDVPRLLEQHYNIIIIDLESNREYALELVESICANDVATVMVYLRREDRELIIQCMRAGVREILTVPFTQSTVAEALIRAAARQPAAAPLKKTGGRLLAFVGAKGGAGVTTIACNFAVALAQDSSQSTLLIDLDLPLGDAALNLGLQAEYSTVNALQESGRLDWSFLSKLLVEHSSGLKVLASPGKFPHYQASNEAIDKLLTVARQNFDNVVVDIGSKLDYVGTSLFKEAKAFYLVTQASIPELRNSNRMIVQFFSGSNINLEMVVNRYQTPTLGVGDEHIAKALTRPVQWKIPNDYAAVRQMQNTATPLVLQDSLISLRIREMAAAVSGQTVPVTKKKGFSFRSLGKGDSSKSGASEEVSGIPRITPRTINTGTSSGTTWPEAKSDASESFTYDPPARTLLPADLVTPANAGTQTGGLDDGESMNRMRDVFQSDDAPTQQSEPQTRVYKGVTYVKGADGQWHLKQSEAEAAPSQDAVEPASPEPIEAMNADADDSMEFEPIEAVQETPAIEWQHPEPITYGTPLGATQLNATCSIPGKFMYAPAKGYRLPAGTHTIWVTFAPADTERYAMAQSAVSLTVTLATPGISWQIPSTIPSGTPLSDAQLNATSTVPGAFHYSPHAGHVLAPGMQTLTVEFVPADLSKYTTNKATVVLNVTRATPQITWPSPEPITYGTALSENELNAAASVPGTFVYIPGRGAVLSAGTHMPSVVFTPFDSVNYTPARAAVSLTVTKAAPIITWPTPAPIAYGTALSETELSATASVPGTFSYSPAIGEVLRAGDKTLSVTFTPADSVDYSAAATSVTLCVTKAAPTVITWPAPREIPFGESLSNAQLNATASEPGTFTYSPAAGEVLSPGAHTLSVIFNPTDVNLSSSEAFVSLVVSKATPTISWAVPYSIPYGTPLSETQLNAVASVPGTLVYTPAAGEVPPAGTRTLSVALTPDETNDYTNVQAEVSIVVTRANPIIAWPNPAPISYGTPLGESEFNASASVPGTFFFTPAKGTVLTTGAQTLEAIFTPHDKANYASAQATVSLLVTTLSNIDSFSNLTVDSSFTGAAFNAPRTRTAFDALPMQEAFDADPDNISRVFRANGSASLGRKIKNESKPLFEETAISNEMEYRFMTPEVPIRTEPASSNPTVIQGNTTIEPVKKQEERIYKGSTYVKGEDGQWHLKQ